MGHRVLMALALVLSWSAAQAQDAPATKWYVGADIGTAKNGVSDYRAAVVDGRDEKSTAFRLRAGYQFIKYLAMEAGLSDLGSYSADVVVDCGETPDCIGNFHSNVDLRALNLSAVGRFPIGDRLDLHAHLGWMLREKSTEQVPEVGASYDRTSHKVLPVIGVGATFSITPKLAAVAEWNKFMGDDPTFTGFLDVPGSITDESDVEVFFVGVRWRF